MEKTLNNPSIKDLKDNLFKDRVNKSTDTPANPNNELGNTGDNMDILTIQKINNHLNETRTLMFSELERMTVISSHLHSTTNKFLRAASVFSNYEGEITRSGGHIVNLKKRHKLNVLMIYGSFFLFILTVAYIFFKRLILKKFVY